MDRHRQILEIIPQLISGCYRSIEELYREAEAELRWREACQKAAKERKYGDDEYSGFNK